MGVRKRRGVVIYKAWNRYRTDPQTVLSESRGNVGDHKGWRARNSDQFVFVTDSIAYRYGEGNVFTGICLSTGRSTFGGGLPLDGGGLSLKGESLPLEGGCLPFEGV